MESINRQLAVRVSSYEIERIAQACGITIEDVLDHLPAFISSYIAEELLRSPHRPVDTGAVCLVCP